MSSAEINYKPSNEEKLFTLVDERMSLSMEGSNDLYYVGAITALSLQKSSLSLETVRFHVSGCDCIIERSNLWQCS